MRDSQRLTSDFAIDVLADSNPAPTSSGKSVIYTAPQQFLLAPGKGLDHVQPLASIQSAGSDAQLLKNAQSTGSDGPALETDQDAYLLGASAPTTENLAQLQQHQSAAEEAEELHSQDLIRAHPLASPRSAFWGDESRLALQCLCLQSTQVP